MRRLFEHNFQTDRRRQLFGQPVSEIFGLGSEKNFWDTWAQTFLLGGYLYVRVGILQGLVNEI